MTKRQTLTPIKQMTEGQAAWVGAMIEAEGCVHLYPAGKSRSTREHVHISVVNTDVEVISTLLRFVGAGTVTFYPPRPGALGKKNCWKWRLSRQHQVRALAPQVSPWMTVKGQKMVDHLVDADFFRR
jgi:hypothetical protein